MTNSILVTGGAGFIGSNLIKRLLSELDEGIIVNIDNLNDYYDVSLKEYRKKVLEENPTKEGLAYHFVKGNIVERGKHEELIAKGGVYKHLTDLQSFS